MCRDARGYSRISRLCAATEFQRDSFEKAERVVTAEDRFSKGKSDYTARDIAVLEGIQAIRHRPSMYIGSTSTSGLVHLLWEALDNAVHEAVAGHGGQIRVAPEREGVVTVPDEGRGTPCAPVTYHGTP